jgi:hypothetical protein
MRRSLLLATLCTLPALCAPPGLAQQADPPPAPAPVVFFDIAGEDSAALSEFYASVFAWQIAADGSLTAEVKSPPLVPRADYASAAGFSTSVTAPLPGQIRQDPSEKRIYLGVPNVSATLMAIEAMGGTVEAERFAVPGVVVLGLFRDPAGNAMGLVEMDGDRVKIP